MESVRYVAAIIFWELKKLPSSKIKNMVKFIHTNNYEFDLSYVNEENFLSIFINKKLHSIELLVLLQSFYNYGNTKIRLIFKQNLDLWYNQFGISKVVLIEDRINSHLGILQKYDNMKELYQRLRDADEALNEKDFYIHELENM